MTIEQRQVREATEKGEPNRAPELHTHDTLF